MAKHAGVLFCLFAGVLACMALFQEIQIIGQEP
jgi:hypothetical protein